MNCALQRRMLELYLYGQNSITNTHMNRPVNKQTSMVGPYEYIYAYVHDNTRMAKIRITFQSIYAYKYRFSRK